VHGARQMGGGFGGAVLALVDASSVNEATGAIADAYRQETGLVASSFVCRIAGGACEITP
jgi:galactokinase